MGGGREGDTNTPSVFFGNDEGKLWTVSNSKRPLDNVHTSFARRQHRQTTILKSHDAAEAAAMHDAASHVCHG